MKPPASGTAPGKVILVGEHAVVYGRPALAAAIDRRVSVTVETAPPAAAGPRFALRGGADFSPEAVELFSRACDRAARSLGLDPAALRIAVESDLPVGVGLGSSAALSVALVRALAALAGRSLSSAEVAESAFDLERIFHGTPSGIDNTAAQFGGLLAFRCGEAHRTLRPGADLPLVVAIGRVPRQTRTAVLSLRSRREREPARFDSVFDAIGALVGQAERAVTDGRIDELGPLLSRNHELLRDLGVSTPELDDMVGHALRHGATGAKLTGGGGGGAIVCLAEEADRLCDSFVNAGWNAFSTRIAAAAPTAHGKTADTRADTAP